MNIYGHIKDLIVAKTGFKKYKIILKKSKRLDEKSSSLNYHEFEYEGKLYILNNSELKCINQ